MNRFSLNSGLDQQRVPRTLNQYTFRTNIGSGTFSQVRLAFNNINHQYYACKIIRRDKIESLVKDDNNEDKNRRMQRLEDEIRSMQKVDHSGIVQLIDLLKDENFYYVFLEYCVNGELFEYIIDRKKLMEHEAKVFMKEILLSVQYLHSMGIAHRDLKPENIFLDAYNHIKIGDFGFARSYNENELCQTKCGTLTYISPDVLKNESYDPFKSDIWSLGVILFVMVSGSIPWTATSDAQRINQIIDGQYSVPAYLSDQCRDLIEQLMCPDPEKRITLKEAINHPWLSSVKIPEKICTYGSNETLPLNQIDEFFGKNIHRENETEIIHQLIHNKILSNTSPLSKFKNENMDCNLSNSFPVNRTKESPSKKRPLTSFANSKAATRISSHSDPIRRKYVISKPPTNIGFSINAKTGNSPNLRKSLRIPKKITCA